MWAISEEKLFREKNSHGKIKSIRNSFKREQVVGSTEKYRTSFLIFWFVSVVKSFYFLLGNNDNIRPISFFNVCDWNSIVV